MKIAVASKDGISINQHFGHAKQFRIYNILAGRVVLIDIREVENYCLGQHSSQSAMAMILNTINDCTAVLVAKIGMGPIDKLADIGVMAVDQYAYEAVEDSLLDYTRNLASTHDDR